MAVDEQKLRRSLHDRPESALLMDYLPPVGWADIATKQDLEMLRLEVHGAIKDVKTALLMWLVPTIIGSMALCATLARLA